MEAVIDLGEAKEVRRVSVDCLRAQGPWIFMPRWIEVAGSPDGEDWAAAGRVEVPLEDNPLRESVRIDIPLQQSPGFGPIRFIRVYAKNLGRLPAWHPGTPENAWLFVDEILVDQG